MKTPKQIADEQMRSFSIGEDGDVDQCSAEFVRDRIINAIETDRAQREVIPAMYDSSELQGAVDKFNDVFGADYLTILEAGARLKDIVNDYLDQVLIHVDRI